MTFEDVAVFRSVCGRHDAHLRLIEERLGVRLLARGNQVTVEGEDYTVTLAADLLRQLYLVSRRGFPLGAADVGRALTILSADRNARLADIFLDAVALPSGTRAVAPKTAGQKAYLDAIRSHDIVFGVGPAGTGKTYLAMAMAVAALTGRDVRRIILTRPAVEAGERLGFLPGDLVEKVNPYLRPLYDALHDMMDFTKALKLIETGTLEVAPLGFMRGRTLNESFVILDEAQNTTREQMKMFLTLLGYGSRCVITGDITQTDLPEGVVSGLVHAIHILDGVEGIQVCYFDANDVVRHPLVQAIVRAYERDAERQGIRHDGPRPSAPAAPAPAAPAAPPAVREGSEP